MNAFKWNCGFRYWKLAFALTFAQIIEANDRSQIQTHFFEAIYAKEKQVAESQISEHVHTFYTYILLK